MTGPSKAPIRDTNASNTGMVLAIMKAMSVIPNVQVSQHIQWVGVLLLRWREFRSAWTNMNFAGIYRQQTPVNMFSNFLILSALTCVTIVMLTSSPGNANA